MTLKVLHCLDSLGTGGAERSLIEYLPTFREEGVEVAIACAGHRAEGVEAETVAAGVDVRFLPPGRIARTRALRALLDALRPDILHTTHFTCDLTGRFASIGRPVRVVTSLVNTTFDPVRTRDPRVSRRSFEAVRLVEAVTGNLLTDHYHAVSESARQDAIRHLFVPPDQVTVVHRGRSTERLGTPGRARRAEVRQRLGLHDEQPIIIQVGRLEFQKNHVASVRALAQVLVHHPTARLLLVGRDGHETPAVEAVIRETGTHAQILRLGHRDDVPDLLCASDVFVMPSWYEGLPGGALEAMALRVPIVASDIPPVLDAIGSRENALLCAPDDVHALAGNLRRALEQPGLRDALARRAGERFDAEFGIGTAARRMIALYRAVLDA